jgi:hypothetical protein
MMFAKGAFDQDTVSLMGRAFDAAWAQVEKTTFFPTAEAAIAIKSAMANRIMQAVTDGETDPARLAQAALDVAARETLEG